MNAPISPEALARSALTEIARNCLDRTSDVDAALPHFMAALRADPAMMAALLDGAEDRLARVFLRNLVGQERRRIWADMPAPRPAALDADDMQRRADALVRGNLSALFDIRLPGGKTLAKATKAEVAQAAEFYLTQGRTMTARGKWLNRIATAMKDDKTVAESFDDATLDALRIESEDQEGEV
jgi:hypothetical protein